MLVQLVTVKASRTTEAAIAGLLAIKGSDQSMDSLIQQKQAEAEDLAFVFKEVIGSQGQHVAEILSIVDINDIWVITKI